MDLARWWRARVRGFSRDPDFIHRGIRRETYRDVAKESVIVMFSGVGWRKRDLVEMEQKVRGSLALNNGPTGTLTK